jgi:hypothetical protein
MAGLDPAIHGFSLFFPFCGGDALARKKTIEKKYP